MWTFEKIEALKKCLADGLSASQIAAALGAVSRNAVIGKVARLGLSLCNRNIGGRPQGETKKEKRLPRRTDRGGAFLSPTFVFTKKPTTEAKDTDMREKDDPPTVEQRRTLLQLESWNCRWPYGEPGSDDFFFCGAHRDGESSYCAKHRRIGTQRARAA